MMTSRAALVAIFAALACSGSERRTEESAAPIPAIALPTELARVLREYESAYGASDAAALAALFAPDGFTLQAGRAPVRGQEAIQRALSGQGGPLRLVPIGYAMSDSVAYVLGTFGAEQGAHRGGKFVLALRRGASGRWLIAADTDNRNAP